MNDAGKVAFTPKGDYSSTVTYEYLDTVVYNGNAYVALKTTTGNAPADDIENWVLLARGGTSIPTATEDTQGAVKASGDIGVDSDAHMVLKTDFTEQTYLTKIQSGEARKTFFGKIAKAVSDLISHVGLKGSSSVAGHLKISNSVAITNVGEYALDATEKNASISGTLANQIDSLNSDFTNLKTNFSEKLIPVDINFSFTDEFSVVGNRYKCQSKDNRVCLYMHVLRNANMSAGGTYGIGNILSKNEEYKPKIPLQILCVIDDGGLESGIGIITIQVNGVINLIPLTSGTTWRRASISVAWDV